MGAEQSLRLLQDAVPPAAGVQAFGLEEVLEGLAAAPARRWPRYSRPSFCIQLWMPGDDAVGGVPDAEAQGAPVAQGAW